MQKEERIVSRTASGLREKTARGEALTGWDAVDALTDEEIEQNALDDYAENGEPDWDGPIFLGRYLDLGIPKYRIDLYLDEDVLEWLKAQDGNMQFLINDVLRAYMEREKGDSE